MFRIINFIIYQLLSFVLLLFIISFLYNPSNHFNFKNNIIIDLKILMKYYFYDNIIDLSKLNFNGNCSKIFKYEKNNKKDLLLNAIYYKNKEKWFKEKERVIFSLSINNKTIPNCTKILIMYGEEPEEGFIKMMNEFGYNVLRSSKNPNHKYFNAAIERFFDFYNYLQSNKTNYDRVAITDFRDVIWLNDGFSTFSDSEIIITNECSNYINKQLFCRDYSNCKTNRKWMRKCYGKEITFNLQKNNKLINNVGLIIGGIDKMVDFTKIFIEEANKKKEKHNIWGIDQSIMNYIVHYGFLEHLNISFNKVSQQIGLEQFGGYIYNKSTKSIMDPITKCSPVIRHKISGRNIDILT